LLLHVNRFAESIRNATENDIRSDVTLNGRLVLNSAGPLVISYAPFEHIQHGARVAIIGITPGAQQAANALCEFRRQLLAGIGTSAALAAAKVLASFSGPMRVNLVAMLDRIGLARWLKLPTTAALWASHGQLVHFTSVLRYPVRFRGSNYNGQPSMTAVAPLLQLVEECLREEVAALPDGVWIPLGRTASVGLQHLVHAGALDPARVLPGLPHPSGANGERVAYFLRRKAKRHLSLKTNPAALDAAHDRLCSLVEKLPTSG